MFTQLICSGEFFTGTLWAFVPAVIAIILALITKQVYLSLFAGIFTAAMFLADGNPVQAISNAYISMANAIGGNGCILIFLVILGIFSVLMIKTGGSKAYGEWASTKIKSQKGAQLSTLAFGCLIFVDDYFNCLTVGNVMRPVTDKHKISRAKLAYLIDSTAAPVCIIAPISSWAAAVAGYASDADGIMTFVKTIPFNLYALLTLAMMVVFICLKLDIFKMKRNQKAAEKGDLFAGETEHPAEDYQGKTVEKGKIINLLFPIITLIVCCIGSMIYNGYFYNWDTGMLGTEIQSDSVLHAFSNCDAGSSLALGSAVALIITFIFYIVTKTISFKECMNTIVDGFKSMVPAILILTFAWTLSSLMGAKGEGLNEFGQIVYDGTLNAKAYIQSTVSADSMALGIIPFVFFILACFISFSTGTSWGTFGVLIPISIAVMSEANPGLFYLTMSAVLAGSVYGDHVSPISDTTIMASSGAQCNHVDHVRTQLPYASIVAIISALAYLASGFIAQKVTNYGAMAGITLAIGFALLAVLIVVLYFLNKKGILDKMEEKFTKAFSKKKAVQVEEQTEEDNIE